MGGVLGEKLASIVVAAVVVVWVATTVVLPLTVKGYSPPPEVGTVMGIVAGGAVAVIFAKRVGKNGNGNGNGSNGKGKE